MIPHYSENFKSAVAYVLSNEGGFVNNVHDSGGPTNFGLTIPDLSAYRGYMCSEDDIKLLTVDEAVSVYYAQFWCPSGLDPLVIEVIPTVLFDTVILYGLSTTIVRAQSVLNSLGCELSIDGRLGSRTREALEKQDIKTFVTAFHQSILERISVIIYNDPINKVFELGWTMRANKILTLV